GQEAEPGGARGHRHAVGGDAAREHEAFDADVEDTGALGEDFAAPRQGQGDGSGQGLGGYAGDHAHDSATWRRRRAARTAPPTRAARRTTPLMMSVRSRGTSWRRSMPRPRPSRRAKKIAAAMRPRGWSPPSRATATPR